MKSYSHLSIIYSEIAYFNMFSSTVQPFKRGFRSSSRLTAKH